MMKISALAELTRAELLHLASRGLWSRLDILLARIAAAVEASDKAFQDWSRLSNEESIAFVDMAKTTSVKLQPRRQIAWLSARERADRAWKQYERIRKHITKLDAELEGLSQ